MYKLIILFILVGVGASAITMEEWMRRGGPKRDPYNSKCMSFCNTKLYECRQKLGLSGKIGDAWIRDSRRCQEAYSECTNVCRATK